MKRITVFATLIPLLFLLNGVNAQNIYTSDSYYTAGSSILIKMSGYAVSISPISGLSTVKAVYELKDANGNIVYKWVHNCDNWDVSFEYGFWVLRMYDEFEIELPNMMGFFIFEDRPEGQWEIESYFDVTLSIDLGEHKHFRFNVYKGNLIDNLFAPIYLYKGYRVFGIEIAHFKAQLPPLGILLIPILIIIAIILFVRYVRFAYKEGKKFISLSKSKIRKELNRGEEK